MLGTGAAGTGSLPPISGAMPGIQRAGTTNLFVDDSIAGGRLQGIGDRNTSPMATRPSPTATSSKMVDPDKGYFYK